MTDARPTLPSSSHPLFEPAPLAGPAPGIARGLVVSIHDVSPLTRVETEKILERLEALGVPHCSLLVVPDHHRRGHFLDDPAFCSWLLERAAIGDEAVIHGYHHRREQKERESVRDKLTTRFYTAGEGEFFDMSGSGALWLISEARQEFRKIGLDPQGFIAPAWLLSEGSEQALRKLGFAYTARLRSVVDLACGRVHPSQSLVWSVRSAWRRFASRRWNNSLFDRLNATPLMRIGIHPVDIAHPKVWRQIEEITRRALADRTPVPYVRWIETSRSGAHVFQS